MKKITSLFALVLMAGAVTAQTTWNGDAAHSQIGFTVTHMAVSEVSGNFKDFTIKVISKSDDFNGAEVEFSAKVASINTLNERRDGHLKSPDFFDAEKFPDITFKGTIVKEEGKYKLKGPLTMKGVSRLANFDVTYGGTIDTGRGLKAGFNLEAKINRQDFGIKWENKLGSGESIVSNTVKINCQVELNKE